jgi:hypothetical protein
VRVGSQHGTGFSVGNPVIEPDIEGREVGAEVMEAEGHTGIADVQFITIGSQHAPGASFCVVEGESEARCDGTDVMDADGQINAFASQFIVVGSQQEVPEPPDCLGVVVAEEVGQIGISDVHCILVGSQHPVFIGVGLAEISRTNMVEEGDGVIIAFITSEQRGSPGVHEPLVGSQHRTPLILESPAFWLKEPTINAERNTKRRNIVALLCYAFFSGL